MGRVWKKSGPGGYVQVPIHNGAYFRDFTVFIFFRPLVTDNSSRIHYGLLKSTNSWANDDTFKLLGPNMTNAITARLTRSKPLNSEEEMKSEVHLYLDPECRYAVSVRPNLAEIFGQIVRFYYPMILPLSLSIVLMILAHQLNLLEKEGQVYACHRILWSQISPISSVMPARLLTSVLPMISLVWIKPDFTLLAEQGVDFGMLPIMMYFVSIGFVMTLTLASFLTVVIFGNIISKFAKKIFNANNVIEDLATDAVLNTVTKFPIVLSLALLVIGTSTCGSLALCLGTLCHFLKLFKYYKSYLEWLTKKSLGMIKKEDLEKYKSKEEDFQKIYFNLTFGLLWALTTVLNLPSLLAWSHNLSLGIFQPLSPDFSLFPTSVIYSISISFLWQDDQPYKFRAYYHYVSTACQFSSILIVLFGLVSLYRINYILSFVMICLISHRVFAPVNLDKVFITDEVTETQSEEDKVKTE